MKSFRKALTYEQLLLLALNVIGVIIFVWGDKRLCREIFGFSMLGVVVGIGLASQMKKFIHNKNIKIVMYILAAICLISCATVGWTVIDSDSQYDLVLLLIFCQISVACAVNLVLLHQSARQE